MKMDKGYYLVSYKYGGSGMFDSGGYGYKGFFLNEAMPPDQFITRFLDDLDDGVTIIIAVSKLA